MVQFDKVDVKVDASLKGDITRYDVVRLIAEGALKQAGVDLEGLRWEIHLDHEVLPEVITFELKASKG